MIEKLSDNKRVSEIIENLAYITREDYSREEDEAYEVIKAFKELGCKLDAINKKYSAKDKNDQQKEQIISSYGAESC